MKTCYLITFDLKNPGLNLGKVVAAIKTAKSWARLGNTAFVVFSESTAAQIRDILLAHMYQGDKIYVGQLHNHAAWYGLEEDVAIWLSNNQK
jgi:hypothetical protein